MAQPGSETRNLVLKWKQEEQVDAFLASNQMRCSTAYADLLQQGIGQTCVIYVPKGGAPNRPDLNTRFAAKAVLHDLKADPHDKGRVVLHLANLTPLPFPTPRELNGILLESGEAFGRRDYSREQHVIRKIDAEHLASILYFGEAGTMIGFGSSPSADARNISIGETYPGLSDNDGYALEDPAYHARMARTRDPRIREQTLLIDQGRCVISSHQVVFRGRAIGVEVVHLWPLGLDGRDDASNTAVMHVALHQLYDRFVFTLSDEFEIIWAPDADLDVLTHGLHIGKRAHFLRAPTQMPDLMNIRWHRERFFQLQQSFGFAI